MNRPKAESCVNPGSNPQQNNSATRRRGSSGKGRHFLADVAGWKRNLAYLFGISANLYQRDPGWLSGIITESSSPTTLRTILSRDSIPTPPRVMATVRSLKSSLLGSTAGEIACVLLASRPLSFVFLFQTGDH